MSTLKTVGLVVGAALLLYGMQRTAPGYADITSPIAAHGAVGEKIAARGFDFQVTGVKLGRRLRYEAYGREHTLTTSGVWAVAEVMAEARSESLTVKSAEWLGPNGAHYSSSDRLGTFAWVIDQQMLEPGLPRRGVVVFEVPESQVAGATMLVAQTAFLPLDSELRIELDVDPSKIADEITLEQPDGV